VSAIARRVSSRSATTWLRCRWASPRISAATTATSVTSPESAESWPESGLIAFSTNGAATSADTPRGYRTAASYAMISWPIAPEMVSGAGSASAITVATVMTSAPNHAQRVRNRASGTVPNIASRDAAARSPDPAV
jgi:hypothetical protein